MKVIALKTGYDGLKRRKEGDVFDYPIPEKDKRPKGWKLPTWVEAQAGDSVEKVDQARAEARAEHKKQIQQNSSPQDPPKADDKK
jgi:ribosomal protein S2